MRRSRLMLALALVGAVLSTVTVAAAIDRGSPPIERRILAATAQGASFTYQGRLVDGGNPANGAYDLRFILFDAETGGAQVGSTVTRENVVVANGLFTVDLDFGTAAFSGDARWLEIAVRPGTSTGTYTVLSPRQAIQNAPYAIYAQAAGSVDVPFAATGSSAGAAPPAAQTGLVDVTQSGTGIAVAAHRTTADAATFPALYGVNSGGGAGVQGESTNAAGVGVQGFTGNATGTAARFVGAGATSTALEIGGGALVMNGTPSPAFVHEATAASIAASTGCLTSQCTTIDHPLANGDADAILLVTPRYNSGAPSSSGVYNDHPIGVWYQPGINKWAIFNQDLVAMPAGAKFNVLVITTTP